MTPCSLEETDDVTGIIKIPYLIVQLDTKSSDASDAKLTPRAPRRLGHLCGYKMSPIVSYV